MRKIKTVITPIYGQNENAHDLSVNKEIEKLDTALDSVVLKIIPCNVEKHFITTIIYDTCTKSIPGNPS